MTGLIIDNFAGGGGASTGIEAALGRPVDVAINHDPEAVAMHAANHPATRHFCQSIMAIDPRDACTVLDVDGRGHVAKVRFAWFSPDCKHHSKAKGGKPREKNIRDLAWVVVHWPERLGTATEGDGAPPHLNAAPDVIMLDRFAVVTVTIDAVTYVIVDIGMRMLSPRELARAQGFPDSYILDPIGPNGRPLSKSAQIRMIGNSVCPDVAEALVRANLPDECAASEEEAEAA